MACPYARNNPRRGPANRRANRSGADEAACPATANALAQEFYGTETEACVLRSCTDFRGTTLHNARHRNPFWPSFAHPRWLSCRDLYNCRRR